MRWNRMLSAAVKCATGAHSCFSVGIVDQQIHGLMRRERRHHLQEHFFYLADTVRPCFGILGPTQPSSLCGDATPPAFEIPVRQVSCQWDPS